ncbi:MAG: hypothetical protein AB7N71_10345 [Phycisphaerae bacterium]
MIAKTAFPNNENILKRHRREQSWWRDKNALMARIADELYAVKRLDAERRVRLDRIGRLIDRAENLLGVELQREPVYAKWAAYAEGAA